MLEALYNYMFFTVRDMWYVFKYQFHREIPGVICENGVPIEELGV